MRATFICELLIVSVIAMAVLMSLGGCLATKPPSPSPAPWVFYQAYDDLNENAPAPFFLTMKEAQQYCERMNAEPQNNYQVSFIAR